MTYRDGDIVNGHRYDAASNSWQPLTQTTAVQPASGQQSGRKEDYWDRNARKAAENFVRNERKAQSYVREYLQENVRKEDFDLSTSAGRMEYMQAFREAQTQASRRAFWKFRWPLVVLPLIASAGLLVQVLTW